MARSTAKTRPPSTPPTMAPIGVVDLWSGTAEAVCWAGVRVCVDGDDVVDVGGWEAVEGGDVDVGAEEEDEEGLSLRTKPRLGAMGPLIL